MKLAPIALFAYNRLSHLRQTVESLKKNCLAEESELFIFSDGPKIAGKTSEVERVRAYLKTIRGFKMINIIERPKNYGLGQSIICGVTEVINKYGKVIVLEDDLMVSPYFLRFMNDALACYENEEKVISICGYMYPIKIKNKGVVFFRIPDCWGWGTWKRAWDIFEPDGNNLIEELKAKKMIKQFNLNGAYNFMRLLRKQAQGKIESWDIRWYASSLLNNKLSVYPYQSLVKNIGLDFSGTNCGLMSSYNTQITKDPILVNRATVEEDKIVLEKIERFFRLNNLNILRGILNKAISTFKIIINSI